MTEDYYRHSDAAWEARSRFDLEAIKVNLVTGAAMRDEIDRLREFLVENLYSKQPFNRRSGAPTPELAPSQIEEQAIRQTNRFVRKASKELWGREWTPKRNGREVAPPKRGADTSQSNSEPSGENS